MRIRLTPSALASLAFVLVSANAHAQWTNRYPRNVGFNHQVYLEGYELPLMGSGAVDVAASATQGLVIASRGWLWRLDEATGVATRLTKSGEVDSRPAWSPDGSQLAFVRDNAQTLAIMVRDMASGREIEIDRGMAMDPVFTPDGKSLVYTNQTAGDLDLWRADLSTLTKTRLTQEAGLELRPQLFPDGARVLYTSKSRTGDQVRLRALGDGKESTLLTGSIISNLRPALSPDGKLVAYPWPASDGWELRLMSTERTGTSVALYSRPRARPIDPAWSADGKWIYFSEGDSTQRFHLFRIAADGGAPKEVPITHWEWGTPTGRLVVRTKCSSCKTEMLPARLYANDAAGHPLTPSSGMARFDGQNGRVYFYSNGSIELEVPAGSVEVRAVRGLATMEKQGHADVAAGGSAVLTLDLEPLWDAHAAGYYAGDHHFHLNYGGQVDLAPRDLYPLLQGEALDVATPMLANLHNRFEDQEFFRYASTGSIPLVRFAQEVRPHFLGHIGLLGTSELFWPWVWGPGYDVNGRDDRPNIVALAEGRRQGGLGYYVHPISGTTNPFSTTGMNVIPISLIPDAAHGAIDLLEIVCLWSNAVGTTELWYRLLNAGFPVAPSGGTDVMTDFHRTMALGSTRVYVRPEGALTWDSYMAGLAAGRSFVTTGPMLEFSVNGTAKPGDVIVKGGMVKFTLKAASAVAVDSVAIVVNGKTMRSLGSLEAGNARVFEGSVPIPAGGWIGARAVGPKINQWPAMADMAFAHTAPIWIGSKASTEPIARRAAATDLLRALDVAEQRLMTGYAGAEIPKLKAHFAEARVTLQGLASK
ncbi:MAG: CehA/McbA family metallohydrolase [Gemmatimonadaceae bacterium]